MKKEIINAEMMEYIKFGFGFYVGFNAARLIKRVIKVIL